MQDYNPWERGRRGEIRGAMQLSQVYEWRQSRERDETKHCGLWAGRRKCNLGLLRLLELVKFLERKELCIKGSPEICTVIPLDFWPNTKLCREKVQRTRQRTNTKEIAIIKVQLSAELLEQHTLECWKMFTLWPDWVEKPCWTTWAQSRDRSKAKPYNEG